MPQTPRGSSKKAIGSEGIAVFVRMRPAFREEVTEGDCMRSIRVTERENKVWVRDRFVEENSFDFNGVFGPTSTQQDVFEQVGKPAVKAALSGRNGTFMAYGQTGTGKTYTAFNEEPNKEGLMARCVGHVFDQVSRDTSSDYQLSLQYLQLYNDSMYDLLTTDHSQDSKSEQLAVREDTDLGTYVSGARDTVVTSYQEVLSLFESANRHRIVRLTSMNAQSSRSHAIFILSIRRTSKLQAGTTICGKLTIVDLAGSERIKRTRADGVQRSEAQAINKSLACLGNVIHALADQSTAKNRHIPYRDSKLTRLLQDSLGEYGHASIMITFSPALVDITETSSSLAFGQRALKVRRQHKGPRLAVDHKALTRQLQLEIRQLKSKEQELFSTVERHEQEVGRMRSTIEEDEALIDEMEIHMKQCGRKIQKLQLQVTSQKESVNTSSSILVNHEEEKSETLLCHAAEIQKLRGEMERCQQNYESDKSSLLRQLTDERGEKDALRIENERLKQQLGDLLHENNSDLQEEVMVLTSEVITARSNTEVKTKEVQLLQNELSSLRSELSSRPPSPNDSYQRSMSSSSGLLVAGRSFSLPQPEDDFSSDCGMGVAPRRIPLQQLAANYQ